MHETIIVNELYRKIDNIVDRELYGELFVVMKRDSIRINQNLNKQIK